jgi:hypothetical protein
VRQLVVENQGILHLASLSLGAFALIFGTKMLGGSRALIKPGGFYSSLLFAIPATAWFGVYAYLYDTLANHLISTTLSQAAQVPIDTLTYAIGFGLFTGALPALFLPSAYGVGGVMGKPSQPSEKIDWSSVPAALVFTYVSGVIGAIFGAQYVLVILGWFGGHVPPLGVFLLLGAILPLMVLLSAFVQAVSGTSRETSGENPGCAGGLALLLIGVLSLAGVLAMVVMLVANLGFAIYLVRAIGWAALLLGVAGGVAYFLLAGLRALANRLNTQALVGIFTFPGAIAALLALVLSNVSVLPH